MRVVRLCRVRPRQSAPSQRRVPPLSCSRACHCSPFQAAANRQVALKAVGHTAVPHVFYSNKPDGAKARQAHGSQAGFPLAALWQNARPFRQPPLETWQNPQVRWPASGSSQSVPRPSSAHPPSLQNQTPAQPECQRQPLCLLRSKSPQTEPQVLPHSAPSSAALSPRSSLFRWS